MKKQQFTLAVLVACMCFLTVSSFGADATITNRWVGASGGDWGVDANWSLEHVPKANELAYFDFSGQSMEISVNDEYTVGTWYVAKASKPAPLTFKGTGKILHGGYSPSPYILNNHPFTLDGVTFDIGAFHSLWYSPVTLKNGGTFIAGDYVYLWNSSANFNVNGGCFRGGKLLWAANVSVTIDNGDVSCSNFDMRNVEVDGAKKYYAINLSINEGGSFACSGDFNIYRNSSLAVKGGSLTTEGAFNVESEVALDLHSGAITNSAALSDRRFITENKGVSVCIKDNSNKAVFFDDVVDGDELVFNAPFYVPNGYFSTTNSLTLVSKHPFQVERFYYLPESTAKARFTLKLDQVIVGKGCIMDTGDGDARTYKIEGPTVWRPTVESMKPKTSRTVYPQLDGELVVDTRDWVNPELCRKLAIQNLGSDNGNGALVIRGGGEFSMTHLYSYFPYKYVTVEEGSTLELQPYGNNSEFAPLSAMNITLRANATLKIPGGANCVAASEWIVDPSARIVVDIPDGTPAGGLVVLRDYSGRLADCSSQVVLTGDGAEGWTTHFAEGTLSVVKSVGEVDGKYAYEWTGEALTGKWTDDSNWHGKAAPQKEDRTSVCVFGASASAEAITETDFNIAGSYLGQLVFRNSAIKSFAVTSAGERTFFFNGLDNSTASIYSASAVPQYAKLRFRKTGAGSVFSFVAESGPIMIDSPVTYSAENCKLSVCGDIRVVSSLKWPQLLLAYMMSESSPGTCLTVLPGATITVTNQITSFGVGSTAFNVQKGGRIVFLEGPGRFYRWTAKGGKHIIDGTMSVAIPYQGGRDQVYGGEGVLSLSTVEPYSAASALILQNTLTLELASDWTTVAAAADFPLTLKVASYSSPTLKVDSDWKYGPAADSSTQTDAASRALNIGRSAVLTVDAGGHEVEFADPVAGDGTLSITNGTLKLTGAVSEGVTVKLEDDGALIVGNECAVGKLEAAGGALRYVAGGVLECPETGDLSKLDIEFSGGMPTSWTTVLVSTNPINGNVATSGVESRVVAVDGVYKLQCRKDIGFHIILR